MSQLTIKLLGVFQVSADNAEDIVFETDAARALFAYLVLNAGIAFRREVLATLLWPDQSSAEALHALRQTLNRVRNAIGDREAAPPFMDISRQTIAFNTHNTVWLDVAEFTHAIAATEQASAPGQTRNPGDAAPPLHRHRRLEACRPCMERLQQAAGLYTGDLLPGFFLNSLPFEEWLTLQREQLHRQAMEVFYHLAAYHERREEYSHAQTYARQQISLEPWREEAHGQLMRALALSGQRSAALAQYETLRRTLREELGVDPAPETQALYTQICETTLSAQQDLPHNLPAQLTPFLGRSHEIRHIAESLNHPHCRLLTLVGAGGIGKTRLALRAAEETLSAFRDGVYYVPIGAINTPDSLIPALTETLGLTPLGKQDLKLQLEHYLRHKELLLVLDGFERLFEAGEIVADLLRRAPGLTVLATSRARLNLPGEWVFTVEGLHCPANSPETPEACEAVQLFLESARRAAPDFTPTEADWPAINEICRLTEGMPLAIEMAAAWLQVFSCPEIVGEIKGDIDFLTTSLQGIPERHRSLRAVFDSSWEMLAPEEQQVFQKLAIFEGGFDRQAAAHIAGASPAMLAALSHKSLLRQDTANGAHPDSRHELHELLQRYAEEKLNALPHVAAQTQALHSDYYLEFLARQSALLTGPQQREAMQRIHSELRNIHRSWDWAVAHDALPALGRALKSLFMFYELRSGFQEVKGLLKRTLQQLPFAASPEAQIIRGQLLACLGWFTFRSGESREGQQQLEESLALLRTRQADAEVAFSLTYLGTIALHTGNYDAAEAYCTESLTLYQKQDDSHGAAQALNILGQVAYQRGHYSEAEEHSREGLALAQSAQLQPIVADSLRQLGNVALALNRYEETQTCYTEALAGYRALGNRWGESAVLNNLGALYGRLGQHLESERHLKESLALKQEIGDLWGEANILNSLGVLAAEQGLYQQAYAFYKRALKLRRELAARQGEGQTLNNLGYAALWLGQYEEAGDYLEEALAIRREIGDLAGETRTLANLGLLAYQRGEHPSAQERATQTLAQAQTLGERSLEALGLLIQGHAQAARQAYPEAHESYHQAFTIQQALNKQFLAVEAQAGLARVTLAQGRLEEALRHVEAILAYLDTHTLDGTDEPIRIYLSCVQVLQAHRDPRAGQVIALAQTLLQKRAADITNPALRYSFLERVAAHRELAEIAKAQ